MRCATTPQIANNPRLSAADFAREPICNVGFGYRATMRIANQQPLPGRLSDPASLANYKAQPFWMTISTRRFF